MQLSVREASQRLPQLILPAQAGEEVVITDGGQLLARLVPALRSTGEAARVGLGSAVLDWLEQHKLAEKHRRSAAEIDAAIAHTRYGPPG